MKYIVLNVTIKESFMQLMPFTFPTEINHNEFAASIQHCLLINNGWSSEVRSAGFVNAAGQCHGRSKTLGVDAHEDDSTVIRCYDYLRGGT